MDQIPDKARSVSLREATFADLELVMAWRSHPDVYRYFFLQREQGALKWEGHLRFWETRSNRKDWIILLREDGISRAVGMVYAFNLDEETPRLGIYVGEVTLWGKGVGRDAIRLASLWLQEQGYAKCWAGIIDGNGASMRIFEANGFRRTGPARDGEWTYVKDLREVGLTGQAITSSGSRPA